MILVQQNCMTEFSMRSGKAYGDPFNEMSLPETILALKQGVGRLIRTETDRGVMAVLDSRINTRRYSQKIVGSLPRARRTRRIEDVRRFFAQEVPGAASPNGERK